MEKLHKSCITDETGKKTAVVLPVVLPIDEYEELLEDLHDLVIIAERRDETLLNFDELSAKLKADGLI